MNDKDFKYYIFSLNPQHIWRLWNGIVLDLTQHTKPVKIKIPASKQFNSYSDLFEDLGNGL